MDSRGIAVRYPDLLRPVTQERIRLPTGTVLAIPKATPTFQAWPAPPPIDTYGNKPVLRFENEPLFAELAILRLFQAAGWQGVWVDTYRHRTRIGLDQDRPLPPAQAVLLQQIYDGAGQQAGCFDVFCWRGDTVLFAESKYQGHDRIRPTQVRWLQAARQVGLPVEAFLIVEWSLRVG